ncbi:hypothetical protein F2Q69_00062322 [Brassica cretica]|uniref:RNase H type-1 domain-containing protein n=1 Tax=Brassica cretica TaxID=69181 RepID=A0A8S9RP51_BRACR|nr:hypothetical protein F2Q69_00062322 [Brassica cretica]
MKKRNEEEETKGIIGTSKRCYHSTEEGKARIPWILWFLWKARNEKVFSNKDISPLEVLQSAVSETTSWCVAQISPDAPKVNESSMIPEPQYIPPRRPFCRIDASWKEDDARYRGGFVIENEDGSTMFGSIASNRVLSPLHAEFATLLWAMKSSLSLGHVSMAFESDCLQLVRLIEEEEEWPTRNEKVFSNKDISPLEVLQSAVSETTSWCVAQISPDAPEVNESSMILEPQYIPPRRPFCRIDASWKEDDARYGGGFVMENEDGSTMFGSIASNRVLSPLHAEFATLLWAMKSSLSLGHVSMAFESDCLQLVRLIEEEEEWPSLMAEFDEFLNLRSMF